MTLERLVIGIDFSTHSVEAARWATNQFAPGAEVVLVHVIPIPERPPIVRSRLLRGTGLGNARRNGRRRERRAVLGSVVDGVLRGARVQCLWVRKSPRPASRFVCRDDSTGRCDAPARFYLV